MKLEKAIEKICNSLRSSPGNWEYREGIPTSFLFSWDNFTHQPTQLRLKRRMQHSGVSLCPKFFIQIETTYKERFDNHLLAVPNKFVDTLDGAIDVYFGMTNEELVKEKARKEETLLDSVDFSKMV